MLHKGRFEVGKRGITRINQGQSAVASEKSGEYLSSIFYYGSSADQFYRCFPPGFFSHQNAYRDGGWLLDKNRNIPDMAREKAKHPPRDDYIEIVVELPRGSMEKTRRMFWVPRNATAGEFINHLAQRFNVGTDWNLYTRQREGEIPTPIRDMDAKLSEYNRLNNKEAQLYFYPEVLF